MKKTPATLRRRISVDLSHNPEIPERKSRVKQEFENETNINSIMAKYKKQAIAPQYYDAAAKFGDFSQVPTFQEMNEKVIAAHELFAALPATVRRVFDNDPGQFIAATETKEGIKLLRDLGLGKPQESSSPGDSTVSKSEPTLSQPDPKGSLSEDAASGVAAQTTSKSTKSLK